MKGQRLICALLGCILSIGVFFIAVHAEFGDYGGEWDYADGGYGVGDTLYYGTYPQTDVTDDLGDILDQQPGTWVSYKYYADEAGASEKTPSDFMRYKDVEYNGEKYRAVYFDDYRPVFSDDHLGRANPDGQQRNGYDTDTVYWFKFEPLRWRVLDPSTGYVMCSVVIDSQPFNKDVFCDDSGTAYADPDHKYYASNYAQSSIRQWLNRDFYNTAFNQAQKDNILVTEVDNRSPDDSKYDAASTNDKLFLLSYADSLNTAFRFSSDNEYSDPEKTLSPSDYARSQGVFDYFTHSGWWLRTAEYTSAGKHVTFSGDSKYISGTKAMYTSMGVVPAMCLQRLQSDSSAAPIFITDENIFDENNYRKNQKNRKADGEDVIEWIRSNFGIILAALGAILVVSSVAIILKDRKKKRAAKAKAKARQTARAGDAQNRMTPQKAPSAQSPVPAGEPSGDLIQYSCTDAGRSGACTMCGMPADQLYLVRAEKGGKTHSQLLCADCARKIIRKIRAFNDSANA